MHLLVSLVSLQLTRSLTQHLGTFGDSDVLPWALNLGRLSVSFSWRGPKEAVAVSRVTSGAQSEVRVCRGLLLHCLPALSALCRGA